LKELIKFIREKDNTKRGLKSSKKVFKIISKELKSIKKIEISKFR